MIRAVEKAWGLCPSCPELRRANSSKLFWEPASTFIIRRAAAPICVTKPKRTFTSLSLATAGT